MSHEIYIDTNGKASMAFVGETPWHGLGQSVTEGASLETWAKEAGLNWKAVEVTPHFFPWLGADPVPVKDHKVLHRSDTKAPLSIVSSAYKVVQPREVLEFFRSLTEHDGWHIHTAGALRGGRKIWAMAHHPGRQASVGKNDLILPNLLLATSLDGSLRTTAKMTAVRVVCANTVAMALHGGGTEVQVSHRTVFNAGVVKRALGLVDSSFATFMAKAEAMAKERIDLNEAREALDRIFFGEEKKPVVDTSWLGSLQDLGTTQEDDIKVSRVVARTLELFDGAGLGAELKVCKGTKWGLFNAVTQMVDHEMGRSPDTRMDSAWFGRGDGFKQEALKVLTAA